MKLKYLLFPFFAFAILSLILLLPLVFGFGKTGKNTTILNQDFSLLSKKEIISRIDSDFPLAPSIILKNDNREFSLNLSSFSARIDSEHLASSLLYRRLNQGIGSYVKAFFAPRSFSLEIKYDNQQLNQILSDLSAQISRPYIPSELSLNNKTVVVKDGQSGQKIDINLLRSTIINQLRNYELNPITIPIEEFGYIPDQESISKYLAMGQKLIGKSLDFVSSDQNIIVDDKTLISWIGFAADCSDVKIQEYVDSLAGSIKKDPVDASFKVENGKVLEFKASLDGYSLDSQALIAKICPSIITLSNSSSNLEKVELPLVFTPPKIKTADVNDLGLVELIGKGSSTFKTSATIRNYNVEKGASIVNRILVAPGETFSFIKSLGEVTLDAGYKQAYVIRQGKTVLDVGGGICQVSTTLFRAMLNAGLDIIQRQNHAYRVHYYEEDMPPGYDATVFIPNPDLKFINDTGHYLLIQNTYDGKNKKLTYEIYGTSDGRKVDISNYRQWDASPAPPDVYIDDPTLPPGKVIQDEHRVPGLKTSFEWKVTRGSEIIHQKTFTSNYTPWAAVYRRGPQI